MEPLDGFLKELGRGVPFEVDWPEYRREVLRRLARAEALRRRRSWFLAAASALAGAAATLLLMHATTPAAPTQYNSPVARIESPSSDLDLKPISYVKVVRSAASGTGMIKATLDPNRTGSTETRLEPAKPFTKRNGASEIRFDGFSEADAPQAGFIVAGPARK